MLTKSANPLTDPEGGPRPKPVQIEGLTKRQALRDGWFPRPSPAVGRDPYRRTLYWVIVYGYQIAASAQALRAALDTEGQGSVPALRARAVLAADRASFDYWLHTLRKMHKSPRSGANGLVRPWNEAVRALALRLVEQLDPSRVDVLGDFDPNGLIATLEAWQNGLETAQSEPPAGDVR